MLKQIDPLLDALARLPGLTLPDGTPSNGQRGSGPEQLRAAAGQALGQLITNAKRLLDSSGTGFSRRADFLRLELMSSSREPLSREALTELVGAERITESPSVHHVRTEVFGLDGGAGPGPLRRPAPAPAHAARARRRQPYRRGAAAADPAGVAAAADLVQRDKAEAALAAAADQALAGPGRERAHHGRAVADADRVLNEVREAAAVVLARAWRARTSDAHTSELLGDIE